MFHQKDHNLEALEGSSVAFLKGKLVATEAEKVALQTDIDLMKEKHRREIEGCKATTLKERSLARRSLAQEYDTVLAVVKDNL